jgi:hypothetical protein
MGLSRDAVNPSLEASRKTSMFCTPREKPMRTMHRYVIAPAVPGGFEQNIHVLHAPGKTHANDAPLSDCAGRE